MDRARLGAVATAVLEPRLGYRFAKRTLDLVVGSVLLLVSALPILVLCVIARIDSPGPAIFVQRRVGQHGRIFRFYKFRTMYRDARERFPELYADNFTEEDFRTGWYKPSDDPRNTRFGRWVRKTSLDELPNFWNVVKGDVSLVGPRPELPEYVRFYTPHQLRKFTVKSGVTGLAQCSGRNELPIQDQIALDLEYVENCSFSYDLRLIWRTIVAVVQRVGAQ